MTVFNVEKKKKKKVKSQIEMCKNKDKLSRGLICVFKILIFTPSISNIKRSHVIQNSHYQCCPIIFYVSSHVSELHPSFTTSIASLKSVCSNTKAALFDVIKGPILLQGPWQPYPGRFWFLLLRPPCVFGPVSCKNRS